tara:strand:- start:359 stop:619 length:261 start_codon:yes stop_codon:yes gene_type:complete
MAIINSYPTITPKSGDLVLITDTSTEGNPTKTASVSSLQSGLFPSLTAYADNADAIAGGLTAGQTYQTDGTAASPLNVAGIVMIVQ